MILLVLFLLGCYVVNQRRSHHAWAGVHSRGRPGQLGRDLDAAGSPVRLLAPIRQSALLPYLNDNIPAGIIILVFYTVRHTPPALTAIATALSTLDITPLSN